MAVAGQDEVEVLEELSAWLPEQRWFSTRLGRSNLAVIERIELLDPAREARVEALVVGDAADPRPPFVQVPLTFRARGTAPEGLEPIATAGDLDVFDGPSDPAFVRAWLAEVSDDVSLAATLDTDSARLISGEQSNSSIVLRGV
ncbi:MAG: hypothetical protein M3Y20_04460, partial [Actinomycetota bacterium]|nr:hypothetical protein [Actinomycetota bacterium]